MSVHEENLDDVISSLIDVDEETDTANSAPSAEQYHKDTLTGEPVCLTERAARQVEKILARENPDEKLYLRVAVDGGGCSGLSYKLGLDHRTEEDKIFESHAVEILVAPKHLMYVEGMQIDYPDGLDARGFTFENPNAVENCGCGTSFAI
jgi:iron-sulfur cluster assembly protein